MTKNVGAVKLQRNLDYSTRMNYRIFRFEAVVDFIEVRIHTTTRNRGGAMKRALHLHGISYVTPVQADSAGWASHFTTRLYDVKTHAALQSKLATIAEEFPFASPPVITMIEVAFDGYLRDGQENTNHDHLVALAARMVFRVAEPVSSNTRIYRDYKGSPTAMPRTLHSTERKMVDGWGIAIGNKSDPEYEHGYFKTTDRGMPLAVRDYRARFELRLAGAALPHSSLESWAAFKFEKLTKRIRFRKEDDAASPLQQVIVAGHADRASHRKSIKRQSGGGTRAHIMPADVELDQIVYDQLRQLSKRWMRVRKSASFTGEK